jgi:hypothetical protein
MLNPGPLSFEPLTMGGELLSLLLVTASFIIIALTAARIKTLRSFQFEMFLFALILFLAETPRILDTLLGVINVPSIEIIGLAVHTVSMVILSAFVAFRIYGFLKSG